MWSNSNVCAQATWKTGVYSKTKDVLTGLSLFGLISITLKPSWISLRATAVLVITCEVFIINNLLLQMIDFLQTLPMLFDEVHNNPLTN